MRIGKLEFTPGFLLLSAWLNFVDQQGLFLGGLVSCALHECGHLWMLKLLRISVKQIGITAVGAEIRMGEGLSYQSELLVALMGPAVNLMMALFLCQIPGCAALAGTNLILACFNMLPITGLDGGRIVRCILSLVSGPDRGARVEILLSRLSILLLCGVGLTLFAAGGNLTLVLTSAWLAKGNRDYRVKRGVKSATNHLQRDR